MPYFQLVLQFRGDAIEDLDEVLEVEDALTEILDDGEVLAGHDIGTQARNIFVVTGDPGATLARLLPFLERARLAGALTAATRPVNDDLYSIVWPHGQHGEFSLV
ncbi:MAG: hypothetical protein ABI624_12100 [Casimicrobiaceae bacterium]